MAIRDNTLTIVTGASSNHVHCLGNLLRSIDHHETAPVVVYDLAMEDELLGVSDHNALLRLRQAQRTWRQFKKALARP